jgi:hypothetical protein
MAAVSTNISHCRIFVVLIVAAHVFVCGATDKAKDVYIVYMGPLLEA